MIPGFNNRAPQRDPLRDMKRQAEAAYAHALSSGYAREARIFHHAAEQLIVENNPLFFEAIGRMRRVPVTIDEFVDSKEFLAGVEYDIWPTLREDLRRMNPDVLAGETPITTNLLGGATGTGKTHLATGTVAYQAYCLTCFEQPQRLFGLTPMTQIVFMLQSVSPTITKRVIYGPFRKMFTGMQYVQRWVGWNKYLESSLELTDNIAFIPAQASLQAILGQAVCGAILDEVNFMQVIEESKQVAGPQGLGGRYDQAEVTYSNIDRRRARSFTTLGPSFGSINVVSSTRYKDDFLDRKIDELNELEQEARERNPEYKPRHLTFRHRQFDVNPKLLAAAKKFGYFKVLLGTQEYQTRVLPDDAEEGVDYPEAGAVINIPDTPEYRAAFRKDPDAALRDIVGVATEAITPFFRRRDKITAAMERGLSRRLSRWTRLDEYNLHSDGMPEWDEEAMPSPRVREMPHYVHIDLSKNHDKCGIGITRLEGFVNQEVQGLPGNFEVVPKLSVVAAIGLIPDAMHEIDIAEVRGFVMQLVDLGFNIRSITFDNFNSAESIMVIRKMGIKSERESVDRYEDNYHAARDLLYQDRIDIQPDCHGLSLEMRTIEWYPERNSKRIDHPPRGTKDILDGVVGSIAGALHDREIRATMQVTSSEGRVTTREMVRANRKRIRAVRRRR